MLAFGEFYQKSIDFWPNHYHQDNTSYKSTDQSLEFLSQCHKVNLAHLWFFAQSESSNDIASPISGNLTRMALKGLTRWQLQSPKHGRFAARQRHVTFLPFFGSMCAHLHASSLLGTTS